MNRVFVDMDGVIANFADFRNRSGLHSDEVKKLPGTYLKLDPFPEGITAVKLLLSTGYDVFIATKPPTGIAFAYADKAEWIFRHLPELKRKLIITSDKGLLGDEGDFLIDDRPGKANCDQFKGTFIPFINGITWAEVINIIESKSNLKEAPDAEATRTSRCIR